MTFAPRIRSLAAPLLALAFVGLTRPCRADSPATAEAVRHYQQGVQLFKDGAYDASLVELQKAYQLAPTYKLLYNVAQVQRQLNQFTEAYDTYDRYLSEGGNDIATGRRDEVRAEMVTLATRIGRLQIVTNAKTPEISVDDVVVSHGALAGPVRVNAGRRRLTVVDVDGSREARVVDVGGGETVRVDVNFAAPALAAARVDAPARPADKPAPTGPVNYTPVWIGASVAVALGAAGAVAGVSALGAKSDYDAALKVGPNNGSAIASAHDRTVMLRTTSDALIGTAIAAGVVTVVLLATRHPSDKTTGLGRALRGEF